MVPTETTLQALVPTETTLPAKLEATPPSKLESLEVSLSINTLPVVRDLVTNGLAGPACTLKSLKVNSGHTHLVALLPLAPSVTTFRHGYHPSPAAIISTTAFFKQAVKLVHLRLNSLKRRELRSVLQCLRTPLETLDVDFAYMNDEGIGGSLRVLNDAAKTYTSVLRSLKWIRVGLYARDFRGIDGGADLVTVLEGNGTKMLLCSRGTGLILSRRTSGRRDEKYALKTGRANTRHFCKVLFGSQNLSTMTDGEQKASPSVAD